jgi:hypothetical protein
VTIRTATSASDSTTTKGVTVTCNAGEKVLGGGALITNAGAAVSLEASYPDSTTSWTATASEHDPYGSSWSVTAYAICAV